MTASREALIKFINEQMLPNDLVSIYQTRGGSSLLQQYTSDKSQLMRAARRIRWYPPQGRCEGNGGDLYATARVDSTGKIPVKARLKPMETVKAASKSKIQSAIIKRSAPSA
jgi:hypothetical protein